jgi:hypothetical protein
MTVRREFAPAWRRNRTAGALSLLVHIAAGLVLVQFLRRTFPAAEPSRLIVLQELDAPTDHDAEYRASARPAGAPVTLPSFDVEPRVVGTGTGGEEGPGLIVPEVPPPAAATGRVELAPRYVTGQLWIPPLPLSREEVVSRLGHFSALATVLGEAGGGGDGAGGGTGGGGETDAGQALHARRLDSAVTAIVQSYLDSVAAEPSADLEQLPAWVAEVGGVEFGVDQQWIYVAGLKIPAAVLALLPLPMEGGNYFRDRQWEYMMEIRRDIYYSAWMADTREQFKENVRKLRERKDREREFARNQRTPALIEDSTRKAPDSGGR